MQANIALNLAPFGRWTLRDKAAQRRSPLRWALYMTRIPYVLAIASITFFPSVTLAVHDDFLQNLVRETAGEHDRVSRLRSDDKHLAVGRESGTVEIWDTEKPNSKRVIKAHLNRANSLAFGQNGTVLFTNSYFEDKTNIWNVDTGELLHSVSSTRGPVSATWLNNLYVIANSSELRLFDLEKRELFDEKYKTSGVVTAVSTDKPSQLIALGTASGSIEIWKLLHSKNSKPTLTRVATNTPYEMKNWVVGVYFAKKARTFYTVARFGNVDEWRSDTLQKVRSIPIKLAHIYSSAFLSGSESFAFGGSKNKSGVGEGYVEIMPSLSSDSVMHKAIGNLPAVEFFPQRSAVLVALPRVIAVHPCNCDSSAVSVDK